MRFSSFLLLSLTLLLACCSDDNEDRAIKHYYYPEWSEDGSLILAAYEDGYGDPQSPREEIYRLAMMTVATGEETIIPVKAGVGSARYRFTPDNKAIAVVQDGLEFYDLSGTLLSEYISSNMNLHPQAVIFDEDGSFLWACLSEGTVYVYRTYYDSDPWNTTSETLINSFVAESRPVDIVVTNRNSYVVALQEGKILEYPFLGSLISEFSYTPYPVANLWMQRIVFVDDDRDDALYTYFLNSKGLVQYELATKRDTLLIDGQSSYVTGFDASDSTDYVIIEVSDGDIWNVKPGLFRRAAVHRFPKFSPNGRFIVASAYVNIAEDTLRIFQ